MNECSLIQYAKKAEHVYECVFSTCQHDGSQEEHAWYVCISEDDITFVKKCHNEIAQKEWVITISTDPTSFDKIFSLMAQNYKNNTHSAKETQFFDVIFKDFIWSLFNFSEFAIAENNSIREKILEHPILEGILRKEEFIRAQNNIFSSDNPSLSAWRDYNKTEREWLEICCSARSEFLFSRKDSWFESVENELNNIFFRTPHKKGLVNLTARIRQRRIAIDKMKHLNEAEIVTKNYIKGMECYMNRYNLNAAIAILFQENIFSNAYSNLKYYLSLLVPFFMAYSGIFLLFALPVILLYSINHAAITKLLLSGFVLLIFIRIITVVSNSSQKLHVSNLISNPQNNCKDASTKKIPNFFSRTVITIYSILVFFLILVYCDTSFFYAWFKYALWFAAFVVLLPIILGISACIGSLCNTKAYIGGGQLSFRLLRICMPRVLFATISTWFLFANTSDSWERVLAPINPLVIVFFLCLTLVFVMYEINIYIKNIWETIKRSFLILSTALLFSGLTGLFLTGFTAKEKFHKTNTFNFEGNKLNSRYVEQLIDCAKVLPHDIDQIQNELAKPKTKFTLRVHHGFYALEHLSYLNRGKANSLNIKKFFFSLIKKGNNHNFGQNFINRRFDIRYLYRTRFCGAEFTIFPLFIFNYAFIATFIALFFQLIFEDKQITEAL